MHRPPNQFKVPNEAVPPPFLRNNLRLHHHPHPWVAGGSSSAFFAGFLCSLVRSFSSLGYFPLSVRVLFSVPAAAPEWGMKNGRGREGAASRFFVYGPNRSHLTEGETERGGSRGQFSLRPAMPVRQGASTYDIPHGVKNTLKLMINSA